MSKPTTRGMRTYIIQRNEQDIDYELLPKLAKILSNETGIVVLQAKQNIRKSNGMLPVEDEEQAKSVSEQFREAGLDNFILPEDELLPLPKQEPLREDWSDLEKEAGLIAIGAIRYETEKTTTDFKPSRLRISLMGVPKFKTMWQKGKVKQVQTVYSLDMLSKDRYWSKSSEMLPKSLIERLRSFCGPEVYLSRNVVGLMQGQRVMKPMDSNKYNQYIKWLYQMRYARPK